MWFLVGIFFVLLASVFSIGWLSKTFIFEKLEPAFVGALVGAAGTIFAACIAYTAASQNIAMAKLSAEQAERQKVENDRNMKQMAREQAAREIQGLRDLQQFLDRLLFAFAGATDGIGDRDFFAGMMESDRTGAIVGYMGMAPGSFQSRVSDLTQRLFAVKNATIQANAMFQNTQVPPSEKDDQRNRLNASIRDRIVEARQIRTDVSAEIERREKAAASN